jgi:hypothetical protein
VKSVRRVESVPPVESVQREPVRRARLPLRSPTWPVRRCLSALPSSAAPPSRAAFRFPPVPRFPQERAPHCPLLFRLVHR